MAGLTGYVNVQDLALLTFTLTILIPGLVIHSFIIGVNVNDWWKGRSVTPVDHIVTSVCISRICSQFDFLLYLFVATLSLTNLYSLVTLVIILEVYIVLTYVNFWLTTVLSIVFCVKISNFQTRMFLYLRRMIVQRTIYFIIVPVLLSAFSGLVSLPMDITVVMERTKMGNALTNCTYNYSIYIYGIGTFLPLIFCCISSVLLFTSLYHHIIRMKRSSNLTINLETYYSAIKFVSFTFLYNTLYFSGHWCSVFYYNFYCVNFTWLQLVLGFLSVLHSSFLIYRTAKLRTQISKVLQTIIDFLFQRKDTETRENIEIVNQ